MGQEIKHGRWWTPLWQNRRYLAKFYKCAGTRKAGLLPGFLLLQVFVYRPPDVLALTLFGVITELPQGFVLYGREADLGWL